MRRGVMWPHGYLDAWRRGEQLSPVAEVDGWLAANPTACADAMADPFAGDAEGHPEVGLDRTGRERPVAAPCGATTGRSASVTLSSAA